jgi:hypothetical protein
MPKRFAKAANQIKPLIARQDGCIASDRITVDGCRVGYMFRAESSDPADSGWMFFSGDEPAAYSNDPDHLGVYALNTIANYDPDIIALLDAPVGSAFIRDKDRFIPSKPPDGWDD